MVDLKNISSENLWYVVGLVVTDGNLSKDGRHINIISKDKDFIYSIKNILGLNKNKISFKARGGEVKKKYLQLQFSDVNFYKYLEGLGLSPKKSLVLNKIKIDRKYFVDFLRGVIDGDGCISTWTNNKNGYKQWSLRIVSASPNFIKWLKNETEDFFGVKGRLYEYLNIGRKNKICILKFGKLAAKVILEKTYYSNSTSLNRKKLKSLVCLHDKNLMLNYGGVLSPGDEMVDIRDLKSLGL